MCVKNVRSYLTQNKLSKFKTTSKDTTTTYQLNYETKLKQTRNAFSSHTHSNVLDPISDTFRKDSIRIQRLIEQKPSVDLW